MGRAEHVSGRKRFAVLKDLAVGDLTHQAIAERHDVARSTVTAFSKRYATAICDMVSDPDNEYAGVWIALKTDRMKEYAEIAERLEQYDDPQSVNARLKALRAAAEEMGHLPTRSSAATEQTLYIHMVDGVNPEDVT